MGKAQAHDDADDKDSFVDELKPGTKLMHGQYTIESFLNAGGFGITYLAKDSLDRKIVIKECFPGAFCRRSRYVVQARSRAHQNELKSIVRLFVQEARSLAKLDHPNIVGVHQVFEDNDTAYMALDFVEGRDLLDTIEDPNHGLTPAQIKVILKEVLGAVGFIHDQGMLHRDISPDNILIDKTFHPVLIDFGAAREEATKQSRVLSALRVVKDGYSPQEFYIAGSQQGPSSDLYALAASFYHLIAMDVPPNSQARLAAIASGDADPYEKLAGHHPEYDAHFLGAIDKALAVLPKDRLQSAEAWLDMMEGGQNNVTPLNVASAAATEDSATPVAAKKSKVPMLMASVAVIALVGVGAGVMTMRSDVPTAGPGVEANTNAVAETAPQITPAPVEDTQTAAVTPAVVDPVTPSVVTPSEPAEPIDVAPVLDTPTEPLVTAAVEPVIVTPAQPVTRPVIVDEPAPISDQAPIVVDQAPVIEEVPAPTPVVIDGPVIVNEPAPEQIRPAARPETVEVAAVPLVIEEPAPFPQPVATPRPVAFQAPARADFPDLSGNAPSADGAAAPVVLPTNPQNVTTAALDLEIQAVTPGNELSPVADAVKSSWTVELPFGPGDGAANEIGEIAPVSPVWVQRGLEITSVNGISVNAIDAIDDVLRIALQPGQADQITVSFGTRDPVSGAEETHRWPLPIIQQTELSNGLLFDTVFAGTEWHTLVAEVPQNLAGDLRVGDMLTSYIPTSEAITARDSIKTIFERELENGTSQFIFAVQRDDSLWVSQLTYSGIVDQ